MQYQLRSHLLANNLSETFQSAYRSHHCTETALQDFMSCLLGNAAEGRVSILTILDFSAAFDTLDHSILLSHLHGVSGISRKAFEWVLWYLSDRFHSVSVNGRVSSRKKLHYGVPQSSISGPILFTLYTKPLFDFISQSRYIHYKFADYTQLHQPSTPSYFHALIYNI